MAQVINTNIQSLTAQRNLNQTGAALQQSIQRLSSGLRINSAKDDAAGLAISERFTTQIRGLNQAVRNANDGISLAQTGEGGLAEITTNLQRIRELAVQAVNATNSDSDRIALNLEVSQRLSEIDRIASQTAFNGRKIIDGTFGAALFQVGANVGETISLTLDSSVRTAEIGSSASAQTNDLLATLGNITDESGAFTDVTGFTTAGATGTAGDSLVFSVGDVNVVDLQQSTEVAVDAELTLATAASGTVSLTIDLNPGGDSTFVTSSISLEASVAGGDDDAEVDALFDAQIDSTLRAELASSGFTIEGTFADGDFKVVRADGQEFTAQMQTSISGTAGTASSTFNAIIGDATAGSTLTAVTAGSVATAGTDTGNSETGEVLSLTGEEFMTALNASKDALEAAGFTFRGSVTNGNTDLQFLRADGEAFDISLTAEGFEMDDGGFKAVDAFDPDTAAGDLGATVATVDFSGTITIGAKDPTELNSGDLSVKIGDAEAIQITGEFSSIGELADAVAAAVGGNANVIRSSDGLSFQISAGDDIVISGNNADDFFTAASQNVAASGSLEDVNVLTAAAANTAIARIDSALTSISELRSEFGAIQNRFESVIVNLTTVSENLSASRSRIRDADFAAETAALTQAQILQQAGIAALSQANAQPQNVLALLQ